MRVVYDIGLSQPVCEWVCFEHEGWARERAESWWRKFVSEKEDAPKNVKEAIEKWEAVKLPKKITVFRKGRYLQIEEHIF